MKNVVKKLEPIVEERREKMKDEMMGGRFSPNLEMNSLTLSTGFENDFSNPFCCFVNFSRHFCDKFARRVAGKLKDLGNTVLGKFGLSLDNFKAEKDPSTGSYSIQFNQS